jgi:hypothetical protein
MDGVTYIRPHRNLLKKVNEMSQTKDLQKLIRHYQSITDTTEINMHEVAKWGIAKGFQPPKPKTAIDLLASMLSQAARADRRTDEATGRPYRAYHSVTQRQPDGSGQYSLWYDIDNAPRPAIEVSASQRRIGIINDAVQLSFDLEHWNRINPNEEPITTSFDLDDEVEWEKHARDAEHENSDNTDTLI